LACHLQTDADPVLDPAYHFDADPDPDFYLMRMRIQATKMMRIRVRMQIRILMRMKLFLGLQDNIYDCNLLGKVCREAYDTLSAAPERKQNTSSTGTTADTRDWQQADSSPRDTGWQQKHRGSPDWQWHQSASSRYKRSDQR
jgi:hypothetical protein